MVMLYKAPMAGNVGSTVPIKIELVNAKGQNLSSSSLGVSALCVVVQGASDCSHPVISYGTGSPFTFMASLATGGGYQSICCVALLVAVADAGTMLPASPTRPPAPAALYPAVAPIPVVMLMSWATPRARAEELEGIRVKDTVGRAKGEGGQPGCDARARVVRKIRAKITGKSTHSCW